LDPLTHFLTGGVIARAGFNRTSALATTTLVLAAEAPDIDVLAHFQGSVFGFAHHRGITHTFLGSPFVAALVVGTVFAGYRFSHFLRKKYPSWKLDLRPAGHKMHSSPPRWGVLFGLAWLAALSHILLDYTNNYGVHPFTPFQNRWYSWDIVFIIEPVLYVILLGGLLAPALFSLVNEEIGVRSRKPRGRTGVILALSAVVAFWGFRDYQHRRAVEALREDLYHGEAPVRVSAYPYYVNPFKWYAVVETDDFFIRTTVNSLTPQVDPDRWSQLRYKQDETPVTRAAENSYLGRVYLAWAQYPVLDVTTMPPPQGGYLVRFLDLRFMYPERSNGALGAYARLDSKLNVQDMWFGGLLSRPDIPSSQGPNPR
jgi:inner membrane protein